MELLSPAGDMERLKMAVAYGADAVYLAGTDFGMRSFAGNFTPQELPQAVAYAHNKGVKVQFHEDNSISIDLHIMVDYGVNLNAVGASIISEVRYVVTKCTGTEVRAVNVYVDSMMVG